MIKLRFCKKTAIFDSENQILFETFQIAIAKIFDIKVLFTGNFDIKVLFTGHFDIKVLFTGNFDIKVLFTGHF